jgi:hypothetical protein
MKDQAETKDAKVADVAKPSKSWLRNQRKMKLMGANPQVQLTNAEKNKKPIVIEPRPETQKIKKLKEKKALKKAQATSPDATATTATTTPAQPQQKLQAAITTALANTTSSSRKKDKKMKFNESIKLKIQQKKLQKPPTTAHAPPTPATPIPAPTQTQTLPKATAQTLNKPKATEQAATKAANQPSKRPNEKAKFKGPIEPTKTPESEKNLFSQAERFYLVKEATIRASTGTDKQGNYLIRKLAESGTLKDKISSWSL